MQPIPPVQPPQPTKPHDTMTKRTLSSLKELRIERWFAIAIILIIIGLSLKMVDGISSPVTDMVFEIKYWFEDADFRSRRGVNNFFKLFGLAGVLLFILHLIKKY